MVAGLRLTVRSAGEADAPRLQRPLDTEVGAGRSEQIDFVLGEGAAFHHTSEIRAAVQEAAYRAATGLLGGSPVGLRGSRALRGRSLRVDMSHPAFPLFRAD